MQTIEHSKPAELSTQLASDHEQWTEVIEPHTSLLDLRLGDVWRYRDLVMMFVRRDFVSTYKQTILGPIWFFIQPLLTTLTFLIVFGQVAKLSTDGPTNCILPGWGYRLGVFLSNANCYLDGIRG